MAESQVPLAPLGQVAPLPPLIPLLWATDYLKGVASVFRHEQGDHGWGNNVILAPTPARGLVQDESDGCLHTRPDMPHLSTGTRELYERFRKLLCEQRRISRA